MVSKSELRKDYFLDRFVVIAPSRSKRPEEFKITKILKKEIKFCPFCKKANSREEETDAIRYGKKWVIRSLYNIYPLTTTRVTKIKKGFLKSMSNYGKHEIVVETPTHSKKFYDFSLDELELYLGFLKRRCEMLLKDEAVNYCYIFKNSGKFAGASLEHEHTQMITSRIVPSLVYREITKANEYMRNNASCVFCDIIKKEKEQKKREVMELKTVYVLAPFASRFEFETWIIVKRCVQNIMELSEKEIKDIARALRFVLNALMKKGEVSYNLFFHQSFDKTDHFHFHIEVCPRITEEAGLELGADFFVSEVYPEYAANFFRGAHR